MSEKPETARRSVRSFVSELARSAPPYTAPSEFLMDLCARVKEPGAALAWLAAHDGEERIRELATMLLFVAAKDPSIPRNVRRPTIRDAAPVLLKAFRDPGVSDEVKYAVGPMAELCGVKIPEEAYTSAFRDHEGITRRKSEESLARLTPHPSSIERQLEVVGLISHESEVALDPEDLARQWDLAKTAVRVNPPVGAALMCVTAAIAEEHGRTVPGMAQELDLAAAAGTGDALWYLGELGRLPSMGEIGSAAGKLAAKMAAVGVLPSPPRAGRFLRGWASVVDGVGSRSLLLLFRSGRVTDALSLLLNDRVGIKDVFCAFEDGMEVEAVLRGRRDITFAPSNAVFARELVGDALAIHRLAGSPPPGRTLLYRYLLGPDPIAALPRKPDLSLYHLEDIPRSHALVEGSADLARLPLCADHYCATDEAYRFVDRHLERHAGGAASFQLSPEALREFFESILIPDLPALIGRLGANLEIEAMAGRASRVRNRRLAALYVALSEQVVPYPLVPFLHELSRNGMRHIAENVLMGFRSQAEANAAAMAEGRDGGAEEDED